MDETATLAIVLKDNASGAAAQAAESLKNLRSQIQSDVAELREMQAALRNLKGSAGASSQSVKELQDKITAKKAAIAKSTDQYVQMGGTFEKAGAGAKGAGEAIAKGAGQGAASLQSLAGAAGAAGGPLAGMSTSVSSLASTLGAAGVAGAAIAAAAAIVALAASVVAAVAAVAKFSIESSNAARDQNIMIAASIANAQIMRRYWIPAVRDAAAAANKLQEVVSKVALGTSASVDSVADFAAQLYNAGLRGRDLETALKAASIKAALFGDTAGSQFASMVMDARAAGYSVEALSKIIINKLGPIAERKLLSLSVQGAKLKENLGQIFGAIKVDGFLKALKKILELFSEATQSGKAIKLIVSTMFNPLADWAAQLGPIVKDFFRGMVVGALLVTIGVLKVRNALEKAFGSDTPERINWLKVALYAGAAVSIGLAVALAVLGVAVAALATIVAVAAIAMGIFLLPFIIGGAILLGVFVVAVIAVVAIVKVLIDAFNAAYDAIAGLDFGAIASDMMAGLIGGIQSGAGAVMSAVQSLAEQMKAEIKGALGIASPSKVFASFGMFTAKGFAEGVEGGSSSVEAAVGSMVSIPAPVPMASGGASHGGGSTYQITIHVNASGGDGDSIAAKVREAIEDIFENVAVESGASLEAA